MAEPKYDLVMVSWVDHVEHGGWTPIEHTKKDAVGGHTIWSVGWLVDQSDNHILVSPHIGDLEATGTMEILVESIKSIHILY